MNWTGGALGRSRNAKASLTAIQKAHFAKVRATVERNRIEPLALEVFGQPLEDATEFDRDGGSLKKISSDSRRKSDPGKCNTNSQTQLENPRRMKGRQRNHADESLSQFWPTYYQSYDRAPSPINISSRPSSSSHGYNASKRPSMGPQIKQHLPKSLRGELPEPLYNDLNTQRARLLETSDWVGISHTKPEKIRFTDFNDRDQIGKRRRLNMNNVDGQTRKRRRYPQLEPEKIFTTTYDDLSQADVSVRIGSAVDRSIILERSRRSVSKLEQVSSVSDEMLLDDTHSIKTANSNNSFCLARSKTNNIYFEQLMTHPGRTTTLSASRQDPDGFQTNDTIIQVGMDHNKYDRLSSHHRDLDGLRSSSRCEPLLNMRKSDGEITPICFTFENAPLSFKHESYQWTSESMKTHSECRERVLIADRLKGRNAKDKASVFAESGAQTLNALPRTFDSIKFDKIHACPDELERRDLAPIKEGRTPVPLISNQDESFETNGEESIKPKAPPSNSNLANESTLDVNKTSIDEEAGLEKFITHNPPVKPTSATCNLSDDIGVGLNKISERPSGTEPNQVHDEDDKVATDEDEALWRSFVFGGEDLQEDWTSETQNEEQTKSNEPSRTVIDPPIPTQTSMEAEVATSPIKRNPHILEQSSSSSTTLTNIENASRIPLLSGTSQWTNSDEVLDDGHHNRHSSTYLSPIGDGRSAEVRHAPLTASSSNQAQASTIPLTTVGSRKRVAPADSSSSLVAQPSTLSAMPAESSSDELAWSPTWLSEATNKSTVVFKKPARYVGQRGSKPVKTIRLGGKERGANKSDKKQGHEGRLNAAGELAWQWNDAGELDELQEDDDIEDD